MPTVKADSGKSIEPVPAGVHQAVCYGVIDLGTQDPGNPQYRAARKVMICWELPHETISTEDGPKPRIISSEYTMSIGKKATLRGILESWRGRPFTNEELGGFDLKNIIGANCLLNIVHKPGKADPSRIYARIQGVMPLTKGMGPVRPSMDTVVFDIPESGPIVVPPAVPEWIRAKIDASDEVRSRSNSRVTHAETVNDQINVLEDAPF